MNTQRRGTMQRTAIPDLPDSIRNLASARNIGVILRDASAKVDPDEKMGTHIIEFSERHAAILAPAELADSVPIIESTLRSCNDLIPLWKDVLMVLRVREEGHSNTHFSVAGVSTGNPSHVRIELEIDITALDWKEQVAVTAAHEYFHAVNDDVFAGFDIRSPVTFGELYLKEGAAERFSLAITGMNTQSASSLTRQEVSELFRKARPYLDETSLDIGRNKKLYAEIFTLSERREADPRVNFYASSSVVMDSNLQALRIRLGEPQGWLEVLHMTDFYGGMGPKFLKYVAVESGIFQ